MHESHHNQRGNASLGLVLVGSTILLAVLSQTQGVVSHRLKASQVKKINLEGHESGLYALSVTRQLVNAKANALPSIGLQNPADPDDLSEIMLRPLETNPSPLIALQGNGALKVGAPDIVKLTAAQMNQIFQQRDFDFRQQKTDVLVKPFAWDPFPSGFGVQTLYLEATANLSKENVNSKLVTRAKVPLKAPNGSCDITASNNGARVADGAQLPNGSNVSVNLHCRGVVLVATLFDKSVELATAGPVTAANNYNSDVPQILKPLIVSAEGGHELHAEAKLVDGIAITVNPLTFSIKAPASADPLVCRSKCTCDHWGDGNDCAGQTAFADPFPKLKGPLPAPMPTLTDDPATHTDQFDKLTDFAKAHGLYVVGTHWQGAAWPNYPNVLICAEVEQKFDLYSFDPANNCEKKFVSARSVFGCLKEDSRILVGPNESRPIETLRPFDRIWNPFTGEYRTITKVVAGPESKPLITLRVGETSVTVTDSHPMRTPAGYQRADRLKKNDQLWIDGSFSRITALDRDPPNQTVWNLVLEAGSDDQLAFVANGILVGDLTLQGRLEGKLLSHEH